MLYHQGPSPYGAWFCVGSLRVESTADAVRISPAGSRGAAF